MAETGRITCPVCGEYYVQDHAAQASLRRERAAAWMYVLTKGWLTQRQIDQATGFGKAAAERKKK
jgi:phage portal protein BeeE